MTPSGTPKVIAVWSFIGIAAVQYWRIKSNTFTGDKKRQIKAIFAGFALSLVIGVAADLNASLGAAFGAAVILGLIPNRGSVAGIFTGAANAVSGGNGGISAPKGAVGQPRQHRGGV